MASNHNKQRSYEAVHQTKERGPPCLFLAPSVGSLQKSGKSGILIAQIEPASAFEAKPLGRLFDLVLELALAGSSVK